MAITLANLLIKVRADTATLSTDLKKVANEAGSLGRKIGQTEIPVRKLAVGLGAVTAAGAGLAIVSKRAFDLGAAVEETASKYRTVLGPAIEEMDRFLAENATKMGLSNREAQDTVATMAAMAQGFGFADDEAAKLARDVTRLGADLASFNNLQGGTAEGAQIIASALAGERERLKQLGIVVMEAEVQHRALAMTNKEAASALTQADKAAASLALIYEKAGKAVGDLDRTQDSAANTARRIGARFDNIRETVATGVMPALEELLPMLDQLADKAETMARNISGVTSALLEMAGLVNQTATVEIAGITRALGGMEEAQQEAFLLSRLTRAADEYNTILAKIEEIESQSRALQLFGDEDKNAADLDQLKSDLEAAGLVMNAISGMLDGVGEAADRAGDSFETLASQVVASGEEMEAALRAWGRLQFRDFREMSGIDFVTRPGKPQRLPGVADLTPGGGGGLANIDAFANALGRVSTEARAATDGISSIVGGIEAIGTEGASAADKILAGGGMVAGLFALTDALFGSSQAVREALREIDRAVQEFEFGMKRFMGTFTDIDDIIEQAIRLARQLPDTSGGKVAIAPGVDLEQAILQGLDFDDVFEAASLSVQRILRDLGLDLSELFPDLAAEWGALTKGAASRMADLGEETQKTADAMSELSQILNAPRGFKVAMRRFQASDPESGVPGTDEEAGGGGTTVHHTTVVEIDGRVVGEAVDEYQVRVNDLGRSPVVRRR